MRTRRDYHIGWICALPLELAAAQAMLDAIHEPLPNAASDRNAYLLGNIGPHNIVITCLPSGIYGTNSASATATQMRFSYEAIHCCLLVGIGGGVPFPDGQDIRLGDIVVSEPTMKSGGVIQYDYGKALDKGQFLSTGTLDKPPEVLLRALARLKAQNMLHGSTVHLLYDEVLNKYPRLRQEFSYPGAENDQLFAADYSHEGSAAANCDQCNPDMLHSRFNRASNEPQVFYGLIASANKVVRDAKMRDQLAQRHGIFCFEMEAAGVMNIFPSLVIRGVCDYSDSHKNKRWQGFAAMVAAAYAKGLILLVPSHDLTTDNTSKVRGSHSSRLEGHAPLLQETVSDTPLSVHNWSCETRTDKEIHGRSVTLQLLKKYESALSRIGDYSFVRSVLSSPTALGQDQKHIFKYNLSMARYRTLWHPWPEDCRDVFDALRNWLEPNKLPILMLQSQEYSYRLQDLAVEMVDYLVEASYGQKTSICPDYQVFWSLRPPYTANSNGYDDRITNLIQQLVDADPMNSLTSTIELHRAESSRRDSRDKVYDLLLAILGHYRKKTFIIIEGTEFFKDRLWPELAARLDLARYNGRSYVKVLVTCDSKHVEYIASPSGKWTTIQVPDPPQSALSVSRSRRSQQVVIPEPSPPAQLVSRRLRNEVCDWNLLIPDSRQLAKSWDDENFKIGSIYSLFNE